MVDLQAMSQKLVDRGERIVMETTGCDRIKSRKAIADAGGDVKAAIVMAKLGVDLGEAQRRLDAADGLVRGVLGKPPVVID